MGQAKDEIVVKICPKRYADGYVDDDYLPDEIKIKPDNEPKGVCWFKMRKRSKDNGWIR